MMLVILAYASIGIIISVVIDVFDETNVTFGKMLFNAFIVTLFWPIIVLLAIYESKNKT